MNSGGISRSRGKGRSSPPPDIDQSKFAGANVTITPSTPKGGQAKRKSGRTWGTEGQPWGVATLILLAIALQLIILVRMGIDNVLPSLLKPLWNRAGSQGSNQGSSRQGETVAGVANGIFPVGCKWRDIQQKDGSGAFWKVEQYEYWDASRSAWSSKQPSSCLVQGIKNPINWQWHNNLPITTVECTETHCIYHNLWHNDGRWYVLIQGDAELDAWQLSRNQDVNIIHVDDVNAFTRSIDYRVVTNDTLIFDYTFFLHPTAIGHWSEMMFPLFSILRLEVNFQWPPAQFLLLHLKRVHLMEWVRAVMATTLGVPASRGLPPIMLQQETPTIARQTSQPLEGFLPGEWVCFERAMVVRDVFTGGRRTFLTTEDAQYFRAMLYRQYSLPEPQLRERVPRIITLQRKRANRRIANEEELIKMLRQYGDVQVVEFDASTPFRTQLEVMAGTGVFISVHTSNLANAQFMQPGSAVIELIQRNWFWNELDKSFLVQTEMMGDLHHFAWRAKYRNQTVYINKRDGERFGEWPSAACATEECVEAHTNVDVVVNLDELEQLLDSRLPFVFAGAPVEETRLPWPPA